MGHCYHHALSSVKKWGGTAEDYLPLHQWFDFIWTVKSFSGHSSTELVVPVVHRRGPAARVARINAQAERAAGRWPVDPPGRPRGRAYIVVVPSRPIPKLGVRLHWRLSGARSGEADYGRNQRGVGSRPNQVIQRVKPQPQSGHQS